MSEPFAGSGYWPPPVDGPRRDMVGYGQHPPTVEWPNGAHLALSLCLNYEEGSERSFAYGDGTNEPNPEYTKAYPADVRDLTTESLFEYGSRVGVHRVLDVLDDLNVPSTVFACAIAIAENPAVGRRFLADGHEICSHGLRWTELWTLTEDEERAHIREALSLFDEVLGVQPRGWYSRYGPSTRTRRLLVEAGFLYDSDAYNDDRPYWVDVEGRAHLVVPYTMMYNDGKFGGRVGGPEDFLTLLTRGFDQLLAEARVVPKMMSIGLHPRLIGQAARTSVLREFLEYASDHDDVWFARRDEIAETWMEQHPEREVA